MHVREGRLWAAVVVLVPFAEGVGDVFAVFRRCRDGRRLVLWSDGTLSEGSA